ncbi:MAG TPA: MarR family transcriptional regulator [Eubacteriaceae bacterium]|jgi:DNA-binding MarR family transcriptional regulator|nr:MarR family transcriptional regulator [Eubacteriaceae bacterium]
MFKLENCVSYIATNASKDLAEGFDKKLKAHGITRVQWTALYYIGRDEEMSQKQLSDLMRIKESSTTRLIDRMEKEGLIQRKSDPENRRKVSLGLTEKGRRLRKNSLHYGEEYSDYISKDISEEEMEIFMKVLDFMRKRANEY